MSADALLARLRATLPSDAVISGRDARTTYACDGQTLHPSTPDVVTLPWTPAQVVQIMQIARDCNVPVVPRGAGTGLSGGALATHGGVLLGTNRLRRILKVDPLERIAVVEPGVVNAALGKAVAPHGLRFAPDPSSQIACTLGGNVAENAGGPHTLRLGVTSNHVAGLVLVTPDAAVHELGACRPGGSQPGDDGLLGLITGSEGLFGVVTRIAVRLVPAAPHVRTFLASFADVPAAGAAVAQIIRSGVVPAAVELMDRLAVQAVEAHARAGFPVAAAAVLIVELEGTAHEVNALTPVIENAFSQHRALSQRVAIDEQERAAIWKGRKQALGALGRICKGYYTHDGVVPPSRLPEALARIEGIAARHGLRVAHVCHAGDGNLHPLILFDTLEPEELERGARAGREILETCLELGGSLTGEHGVGSEKRALLDAQFDPSTIQLFDRVRRAFDPDRRMNPGKLLPSGSRCGERGPPAVVKNAGGWL
jgi:glycolate oxidase